MAARASTTDLLRDFLAEEGPQLRRTALLLTGSWEAADEVLRAVAVGLVTQRTDLDDLPRALATARRMLCAQVRDRPQDAAAEPAAAVPASRVTPAPGDELGHHDDPGQLLLPALLQLPALDRIALVLRHFERLTVGQTADALQVPGDHVEPLVASAIDRLQAILADQGHQLVVPTAEPGAGRTSFTHEEFMG